jgi:NAD(P)-dependent dehydrogenase (short-subunit alcohol dehydrogenase family)
VSWSVGDIPDQSGRVAVVTGATSGLGLATAAELARRGAHVVLTARDPARGEAALAAVRAAAAAGASGAVGSAEVAALDVADLASVRAFAAGFRHDRLDLLVNNAGVMATPQRRTADGFELQIGTNHLGPYAVTGLLLPRLLRTPGSRVVTVSSVLAQFGRLHLDDLNYERRRYARWGAYNASKLANLLFTVELSRRLTAAGAATSALAAHPGLAATRLGKGFGGPQAALMAVLRVVSQSAEAGSLPQLRAATDPDLPSGTYLEPGGMGGRSGPPVPVAAPKRAWDPETMTRLWDLSAALTATTYPALTPARP